jgi:mycofactocin biosynthetic radical S-adenosylmethionine protein MftC
VERGDKVLTGDSSFHLSAYGEALRGLNLCGAGRLVCLIDPVGDVYAPPFAIHENFLAGNVRSPGGFQKVWESSELFTELRRPQTGGACRSCMHYDSRQGGCMAAKFFTGLPLDGPDSECVRCFGEQAPAARDGSTAVPKSDVDHSRSARRNSRGPVPVTIGMPSRPDRARDQPARRARRLTDRLRPARPLAGG